MPWSNESLQKAIANIVKTREENPAHPVLGKFHEYYPNANNLEGIKREVFRATGVNLDTSNVYNFERNGGTASYKRTDKSGKYHDIKNQKLSRFIRKHSTELTDPECDRASRIITTEKPLYFVVTKYDFRIWYVSTRERAGLSSCMTRAAKEYDRINPNYDPETDPKYREYLHPIDTYQEVDEIYLGLLLNEHPEKWGVEDDKTEVLARSLIVKYGNELHFNRVYGLCGSRVVQLEDSMGKAGVKYTHELFDGLILPRINDRFDEPVMPYIDWENYRYNILQTHICVCEDGEYETNHLTGKPNRVHSEYCAHCEQDHGAEGDGCTMYDCYGDDVGQIYGDCMESTYIERVDLGFIHGYIHVEDCTYSDYHDTNIPNNMVVYFISDEKRIEITYENSEKYNELVDLARTYKGCLDDNKVHVDLADHSVCIETVNGDYYLSGVQSELYYRCAITGDYYGVDDGDAHQIKDGLFINLENLEYSNEAE